MDYEQAVRAMKLRLPITYQFGQNKCKYKNINKKVALITEGVKLVKNIKINKTIITI